jgi:phosphoglucosamine mutase
MTKLFGTDGIRGVANIEPMTTETALRVGRAAGHIFLRDDRRHRVLIGKDTRLSGYMLESALVAGICSMGVDVLLVGPLPTPGVAYILRSLRADAGIMISASHNPYEDNGIKFFSPEGFKLADDVEREMERLLSSGEIDSIRPTAEHVGKAFRIDDAVGRYIEFVKATFPKGMTLEGVKVVVDCANGALYKVAPQVLKELGARVVPMAVEPDGENINADCGSQYPERMMEKTREVGADLGLAFDGDGDRVVMSDAKGQLVDGDCQMAISGLDLAASGKLAANTVVATVMSNVGLEVALERAKVNLERTPVGDRYVVERMLDGGFNLGGEQSGHIVFLDRNTTGDGMIAALQLLAIMESTGKDLAELAKCFEPFPQVLVNVRTAKRQDPESLPAFKEKAKKLEKLLGPHGRILVRPSGTEPMIRIMAEGRDEEKTRQVVDELAEHVRAEMGETG